MSEGMATSKPAAVVMSASPIPPASARGSPIPWVVMALNAAMMPVTVPSKPSKA